MTTFRTFAGCAVLLLLAALPAEAAWNNVFQATCFPKRRPILDSYFAPAPVVTHAAPNACCDPCCRTSYVQRCYYQPVTSYKTEMVPVTSYRTSYFWEPVCSYRTSCYIDPCTGCPVQVQTPVTSYRLRSQCNAVVNYVQRCVPVVSYRQVRYWEAVTDCGPGGVPNPGAPPTATETPAEAKLPPINIPAGVEEPPTSGTGSHRLPPPPRRPMPEAPVRLEHVVSRMLNGSGAVSGQVVAGNFVTPLRGTRIVFVSKEPRGPQRTITTDNAGRFNINLASGDWNIYLTSPDGRMDYHSSIAVQPRENRKVMVVSR